MRVLIISPYLPHRQIGHGGGISVRNLVRHLGQMHDTSLLALLRRGEDDLVREVATDLGVNVHTIPFLDEHARGPARLRLIAARAAAGLRGLMRNYPYYVEKYWSPGLTAAVAEIVDEIRPDVIQVEYLQLSLLLRDLRHRRERNGHTYRLFLGTHEMGSLPRERRAALSRNPLTKWPLNHQARAWKRLQADATGWADATFCVTDQDRDLLLGNGGQNCRTIPLGVDTVHIAPVWEPESPTRLLFVGSFAHRPNRVAAKFLVDKMWPDVAKYEQDMEMMLAGRGSRAFLSALGCEDPSIKALGFVEDLTDQFRRCRLFVAPLAEGGGIKIKILEAMARGIPVVTTPVGAEGISDDDERALWIAPPNASFAELVLHALAHPAESAERATRAREIIERRYSWSAIARTLTGIYGRR